MEYLWENYGNLTFQILAADDWRSGGRMKNYEIISFTRWNISAPNFGKIYRVARGLADRRGWTGQL